ncbi:MAG: ATP-binding cassette domain-containing protein [Elusimicrobiota bacterium]
MGDSIIIALSGLSFESPPSSITAVIGPNGAGKTTLLKILSTIIIPTDGTARIGGLAFF